jgi:histidinol-phosphate aminotransferase
MKNARLVYEFLEGKGIIVRDRSKMPLCDSSLRITVGTPEENMVLIRALRQIE